jgi:hypothetical protein
VPGHALDVLLGGLRDDDEGLGRPLGHWHPEGRDASGPEAGQLARRGFEILRVEVPSPEDDQVLEPTGHV